MENLKLTAQTSTRKVFISEAKGLKLWKQKNVTTWFHNCVTNLFKEPWHTVTNEQWKTYRVTLEEIVDFKKLPY